MEEQEKDVVKVLKWAGILALIALPVIYVLKKRKRLAHGLSHDDESNIFEAELEE